MKKNFKRWLALLLAVAMVATSAVYSSGNSLKATGDPENVEQSDQQSEPQTVDEGMGSADAGMRDSDAGTQETGETDSKQVIELEKPQGDQEAAKQETENSDQKADAISDAEQTGGADQVSGTEQKNASEPAEEAQVEPEVQKYSVVFHSPAVDGGSLSVWADGNEKQSISYGSGNYTEEITEGTLLNFQITVHDKYTLEGVTDQNGTAIAPVSSEGNVYTYQVTVSGNLEINTLYKEETQKEEAQQEDAQKTEKKSKISSSSTKSVSPLSISGQQSMYVGDTQTLAGEGSWGRSHNWSASGSGSVTIDADGSNASITATKAGNVTITHTYKWFGSQTETFNLVIYDKVPLTGITIAGEDSVNIGASKTLSITPTPADTTDKTTVTWSSSNEKAASVDKNGVVTGIAEGETVITAVSTVDKNIKASKTIHVLRIPMTGIQIHGEDTVNSGDTLQLSAECLPKNTTDDKKVVWTSADEEVASVDSNGLVTAKRGGSVEITASCGEFSDKLEIRITQEVTKVEVVLDTDKLIMGTATKATAKVNPSDATDKIVTWSSDNEEVAVVDEDGNISTVGKGTANIIATASNGIEGSAKLIVEQASVSVTADYLNPVIGDKVQAKAEVKPEWLTEQMKELQWSSSNEEVADVSAEGLITTKAVGKAEITASLKENPEISASIEITVHDPAVISSHTLSVEFVYQSGGRVQSTFRAQYVTGEKYEVTIPAKQGYTTYMQESDGSLGQEVSGTLTDNIYENQNLVVVYVPDSVEYQVTHRFEQTDGSYKEEIEKKTGYVGEDTQAEAKDLEAYIPSEFENVEIGGDRDINITITYKLSEYTVRFNTNGGSYAATQYLKHGESINVDNYKPTKEGYNFSGWYNDSEFSDRVAGEQVIKQDRTFYAKWTAIDVNYTISYWLENADDTDYSYSKSVTATAKAGTELTVTANQAGTIDYFTFKNSETKTIAANGSTIINVYYSRNTYTLTFYDNRKQVYSATKKYNADISKMLPFDSKYEGRAWEATSYYDYALQTLDRMPAQNIKFNLYNKSSDQYKTIYYYGENVDGNGYSLIKSVGTYFNYITYEEEYHPIQGYVRRDSGWKSKDFSYDRNKKEYYVNLYYDRASYDLTFYNYNGIEKTQPVTFGVSLESYNHEPARPANLPEYYTFQGWYTSEDCTDGSEVDWSSTMPFNDLMVYAKWAAGEYTVDFDTQGGSSVASQTVPAGNTVMQPSDPEREGYKFEGWYTSKDYSERFDFGKPIEKKTTVYAKWKQITTTTYTIKYIDDRDGSELFGSVIKGGKVGDTVYAYPKAHDELVPTKASASLELSWDSKKNVIEFHYSIPSDVYYKVQYLDAETGEALITEKIEKISANRVVETAPVVEGYEADSVRKSLNLANETSEADIKENVITFQYTVIKNPITSSVVNGTIQPSGTTEVKWGGSQTYTYEPSSGFVLKSVIVDGQDVTASNPGSYTFNNVTAPHNIKVTYQVDFSGFAVSGIEKEYDGNSYHIGFTGTTYPTDQIEYWYNGKLQMGNPSFTNAGEYPVTVKVKRGSDVWQDTATVKITKRTANITVDDKEKFFDEADPALTGKIENLVDAGDLGTVTYKRSNTDEAVGIYREVLIAEYTDNSNYIVTVNRGDFEIKTAKVEGASLTASGGSWPYDGTAHGAEAAVQGAEGYTVYYKVEGGDWSEDAPTVKDVADGKKTVSVKATRSGYEDLTAEDVTIEITAKPVTIEVSNAWKYFDDPDPAFTGTVGELVAAGDLGEVTYKRTNTDEKVQVYNDVLTAEYTANTNYQVTVLPGDFEIKTASIQGASLRAEGGSWPYDGYAHAAQAAVSGADGYKILYYTEGGTWSEDSPTVTNVADGTKSVSVKAVREGYEDLTTNNVTIQITPRDAVITVKDAWKYFDDPDPAFEGSVSNLVAAGDLGDISYSRTNKDEDVDIYKEVLTADYTPNTNYNVDIVKGDFEIKTATITGAELKASGGSWEYDGAAHAASAVVNGADGYQIYYKADGGKWTKEAPSVTNVADGVKTVSVKATRTGYTDLTAEDVTIQITAKPVTITVNDSWKYFDQPDPDFSGTVGKLIAAGDLGEVSYRRTNSDEAVNFYADVLTADYEANTNYAVTVEPGDFEIKTASIEGAELKAKGGSWTYDGTAHEAEGQVKGAEGYTVYYKTGNSGWTTEAPSVTDVADGVKAVSVKATRTGYQDLTAQDVTIQITPRDATITVEDAWKYFDKQDPTFKGKVENLIAEGDLGEVSYSRINAAEAVGTYEEVLTAQYEENTNYHVTVVPGDFEIKTAKIEGAYLEAAGGSWNYDGDAHKASAEVKGATGYKIYYKVGSGEWSEEIPSVTNVSEGIKTVSVKATRTGYEDLTAENVTITITPRPVTITVEDSWKYFDAVDPEFKGAADDLIKADDLGTISFKRTNTDEAVGTYTDVLTADYEANTNYDVTVAKGDFEIKTATIEGAKLEAAGGSWTYNGSARSAAAEVKGATGYTIYYKTGDGGWSTNVPSVTNVADGVKTVSVKATRTGYTDLVTKDVTIQITPKDAEIKVTGSWKYFDDPDPAFSGTVTGLVATNDLGTISYRRTNADEAVGTYLKVLTADYEANSNYNVTVVPGDFEIKTASIKDAKLEAAGGSWEYDGAAHSAQAEVLGAEGYTIYYKVGNGDWSDKAPSVTNVADGVKTVSVKATRTGYADLAAEDVTIQITAKPVTITVNNNWKYFDQPDPDFSGTVGELVAAGDLGEVSYRRTNNDEAVNTYPDVLTADYEANPNYAVTVETGDFEIRTASIEGAELNAEGGSWIYDGTAHEAAAVVTGAEGYTVYYKAGDADWTTEAPSVKDVADGVKTVSVKATRTGYADLTAEDVTIQITAKPVTITVNDNWKYFDQPDPDFSGTVGELVTAGDLGEVSYRRTNAAEGVGTYVDVLTADYEANPNYAVTVETGDFEIKTASVEGAYLEASGGSWPYDGTAHEASAVVKGADGYTVYYKVGDADWTTEAPSVTNVADGVKTVSVKATRTGYADLTAEDVTLEITAKPVTITVNDNWKYFDQPDPDFSGTVGELVTAGDLGEVSYRRTNSDEAVDTYVDVLTADYEANPNYAVTVETGDFEIRTASIEGAELNAEGGSWIYDGTAHEAAAVVTGAEGYTVYYKAGDADWTTEAPSVTNVADGVKTVSVKATRTGYADLTAEDVTLEITAKPVTITVNDNWKYFDQPDPDFSGTVGELVAAGDLGEVSYRRTNSDEAVDTYLDVLTADYEANPNYAVTVETGDFEIRTASIEGAELNAEGGSWIYDGTAHEAAAVVTGAEGYTVYYKAGDADWTTEAPSVKDVADGVKTVSVKATRTGYADLTADNVTIQITAKPVTITVNDNWKYFDQPDPDFSGTVGELVTAGDLGEISYRRTNAAEGVGTYVDVLTADYEANPNYAVTVEAGDFEIKTASVEGAYLEASGGSWPYDGAAHEASAVVKGAKGYTVYYKVGDADWTTEAPSVTNVADGVKTVSVKATRTGYDDLKAENVTIEITARPATITVDDDWKYFDQPDPIFTGTIENLIAEDDLGEVVYSRTNADEDVNIYQDVLTADYEENTNYSVTVIPGDFEIKTATIKDAKVTAEGGSWKYDGQAHAASAEVIGADGYTIYYKTAANDWSTKVPSVTNVSEGTVTVSVKALREGYTTLTAEDVTIQIVARPITITAASAEKSFDNTALVKAVSTVGLGQLLPIHKYTATVEGSQTFVGTSDNVVRDAKIYTLAGEKDVTSNYDITYVKGTLTVTDEDVDVDDVVTKTHDGEKTYKYGDTITFDISVKNIYDEAKTITIVEQDGVTITGNDKFVNVASGDVVTTTATYKVTEEDILNGSFTNTVTAKFSDENKDYEKDDTVIKFEDPKGHLTVTKETTSKPANGETYALGETIVYKVVAANDGNLTLNNVIVKDELTGDEWTVGTLQPGQSSEAFKAEYKVTEEDILKGMVLNEATAIGESTDPENPNPEIVPGNTEDPTDNPKGHLTVTKETTSTPANGETYALGETITYKITAVNDGNLTLKNVVVTDELTGDEWTIDSLKPGETSEAFTASHKVTQKDILKGSVVNEATAAGESPDPNKPDPGVDPGETEDPTDNPNGHLTVTKETTSTPENGAAYALGETITYKIVAANDGNLTLKNVVVTDDLTGDEWTIDSLKPGESSEVFTAEYKVTEQDILNVTVLNVATAKGESPDPEKPDPGVDPGEKEEPTVTPQPSLFVEKTATAGPEGGFNLGETVPYTIKVVNNGNVTISDITVNDELTGGQWTIDSLEPNGTQEFTTEYVITEGDILAGQVVNVATAGGTAPDGSEVTGDGTETIETENSNPHLSISKETTSTPANGETYALGETITYRIVAVNDGNLTLTNVVVRDELTGDEWTIESLAPGASSEAFTAEHTVTTEDIQKGSVLNVATAGGETPDPEKPDPGVDPGEKEDPTDDPNPSVAVAKEVTSTPANGESYALGETISYRVTVTNDGNVPVENIRVEDSLVSITENTIAILAPGESREFTYEYTVTEADIRNGQVVNTAAASTDDPEGPKGSDEVVTPAEPADAAYTVNKTIVNPQDEYKVGDTIQYQIAVNNTGNVTLHNVVVSDNLQGASGSVTFTDAGDNTVEGNKVTIREIKIGETVVLNCEYLIVREDAGATISNIASVTTDETGETPREDETEETPVVNIYRLTIHYVDAAGTAVAPDYTGEYEVGAAFSIASPAVTGYTPNYATVNSGADGMPAADVEVTVTYTANPVIVPIVPPVTPTTPATPVTPVTPAAVTPTTPTAIIPPTPTPAAPIDAELTENDEGDYDLTPIQDEETPLAKQNLDDHACCILHFLLMLLALIVLAFYTRSMKKRQARIFELREELELEMARRGLGGEEKEDDAE